MLKKADTSIRTHELRALSILLFAAGTSPLILGRISPGVFLLCLSLFLPIWMDLPFEKVRNHQRWKWFTIFSFSLFLLSRLLQTSWMLSILFLILFSLLYEFYGESRKNAHIRIISTLSFFIVIAQFRFDQSMMLFTGILLFFFASGITLIRFRQIHFVRKWGSHYFSWGKVILPMLTIFIFLAPLSLISFWIIPRTQSRSLSPFSQRSGNFISAFSDRVSLNDIGTIARSNRHVLDLIPQKDTVVPSSYLIGRIHDQYRSGVWTSSTKNRQMLLSPESDGLIHLNKPRTVDSVKPSDLHIFDISVQPIHGNPIFFFPEVTAIEIKDPINAERGRKHFSHPSRFPSALHYRLICEPTRREPTLSPKEYACYTEIHEQDPYYRQKAEEVFGLDLARLSTGQKLERLNSLYKTQFQYTLDIQNYGSNDPVQFFLDTSRQGHCELFASSAVLILRAADVPARLVTGFMLPHMINDSFYHVTEASAHAWVEVFVNHRWHIFDPTSATSLAPDGWLSENMAVLNRAWEDFVMMWDVSMQYEMFASIIQFFRKIQFPTMLFYMPGMIFISAVLFILFNMTWKFYKPRPVLHHFEKLTGKKPALTTWPDYLNSMKIDLPLKHALINWINAYLVCFFSGLSDTQRNERVRMLRLQLKSLKQQWKRTKLFRESR